MSILNKLTQQGTSLSVGNGATPSTPNFSTSKLHNTYSLDGTPNQSNKPTPSTLDLNGRTPAKYSDNLPQ
jgi:hypothetical protein